MSDHRETAARDIDGWIVRRETAPATQADFHVERDRGRLVIVPDVPHAGRLGGEIEARGVYDLYRKAKEHRYRHKLANGYSGLKIVAEGDSWLEFPVGPVDASGDAVRALWDEFAILGLAKAGDRWEEVIQQNELLKTVDEEQADAVILSVGGNMVLGQVERYVRDFEMGKPDSYYLKRELFESDLDYVMINYESFFGQFVARGVSVLVHGYDYCDPRLDGYLIGRPLKHYRGIENEATYRAICDEMLDIFNRKLSRLAAAPQFAPFVKYTKLLGVVGRKREDWFDEAHPMPVGFGRVGAAMAKTLRGFPKRAVA